MNTMAEHKSKNIASVPLHWILEKAKKYGAYALLTDAVNTMAEHKRSRQAALVAMPQLIGRDTGAFTYSGFENFLQKPDGKLTLVDNEPRSLGVVTNIDYLVNEPRVFMYKDIKAVDLEDKKPEREKEPLPILDHSTNLKVRVACFSFYRK
ncbi:hypothetical protein OESDEN_07597 [Oesophagostomum dentatum]|uniref:Uncharacterized protein n=1 Tax=Oesophagostomum dentatum TaxID=61180 RepID=A0A0B1T5J5_OESDE|nr:hypothetical protein OESDEN_07597 [Oesophagostomum dentatum]